MSLNPYESANQAPGNTGSSRPRLTRRKVFWSGIGTIAAALVVLNGSQVLHVHSQSVNGRYDLIVHIVDAMAIIAIVAGCVAIVACHWLPGPQRTKKGVRTL